MIPVIKTKQKQDGKYEFGEVQKWKMKARWKEREQNQPKSSIKLPVRTPHTHSQKEMPTNMFSLLCFFIQLFAFFSLSLSFLGTRFVIIIFFETTFLFCFICFSFVKILYFGGGGVASAILIYNIEYISILSINLVNQFLHFDFHHHFFFLPNF